jgi:hypothetical protein
VLTTSKSTLKSASLVVLVKALAQLALQQKHNLNLQRQNPAIPHWNRRVLFL